MQGAVELAEEIFHVPVRLGAPQGVVGLQNIASNPIHATGVGLLQYGFEKEMRAAVAKRSLSGGGLFEKIANWVRSNF